MRIGLVTPAPPRTRHGNRITALRWMRILRSLGHRVVLTQDYGGELYDLLIALHARRSHAAASRFHREHPDRPLIVALTGTDLYRDLPRSRRAQKSLDLATRIITLQPKALEALRPAWRKKAVVIYQSAAAPISLPQRKQAAEAQAPALSVRRSHIAGTTSFQPKRETGMQPLAGKHRNFQVCVIGHLRPVKDPFRAAAAARRLAASSGIRILQVGGAMTLAMAKRARSEMRLNPRYRWLGERPQRQVWSILARSQLCVLSSKLEGGANVLSEAIVAGIPVLASRIPGSVGILGEDYPGYFPFGDTAQLARLLEQAEYDVAFRAKLRAHCQKLRSRFSPAREKSAWKRLVSQVMSGPGA